MLDDLRFRLRALFRRDAVEEELEEEIRFHFDREVEKHMRLGMNEQEAKRRARLVFGGHEQVKEDCREARGTGFIELSLQDAKYALRQLRANPTFALVMILTLGLSIGANSAIFSVIDGVLLKTLPYPHPERIVRLFLSNSAYPKFPLNPFDFHDYRARNRSFESMAAFTRGDMQRKVVERPPGAICLYQAISSQHRLADHLGDPSLICVSEAKLQMRACGAKRQYQSLKLTSPICKAPGMAYVRAGSEPSLLALSDLHVAYPENRKIISELRPNSDADWLLLAGDVGELTTDIEWVLRTLSQRFATVIWTPGNHELWTHPDDPVQLRGEERYRHLVELCRSLGVVTPEDPYRVWDDGGRAVTIAPDRTSRAA